MVDFCYVDVVGGSVDFFDCVGCVDVVFDEYLCGVYDVVDCIGDCDVFVLLVFYDVVWWVDGCGVYWWCGIVVFFLGCGVVVVEDEYCCVVCDYVYLWLELVFVVDFDYDGGVVVDGGGGY